jgi:hypothetical protein
MTAIVDPAGAGYIGHLADGSLRLPRPCLALSL